MSQSTIERIERADPIEPSVGKVLALKGALEAKSVDELISAGAPVQKSRQAAAAPADARQQAYFDFLLGVARTREEAGRDNSDILDRVEKLLDRNGPTKVED